MKCSVLSSGSKANSTYIETNDARILIDCGLSCKRCEYALKEIGVDADSIDIILVTHPHSDHIKGVSAFSNKHHVPVWSTEGTLNKIVDPYEPVLLNQNSSYQFKTTKIETEQTCHDSLSSLSYKVSQENYSIGYLTDTGCVTKGMEKFFKGVNSIILEFNHDPIMLQTCNYAWALKERIASNYGHLSNIQAGDLLKKIYHPELKMVFLAHISENSNTPDYALKEAKRALADLGDCLFKVTGYVPTQLYDLSKDLDGLEKYKVAV